MKNVLCVFCGGKREKKSVSVDRRWGKRLVVFTDVPAEVCASCGETYFSAGTMERMEAVLRSPDVKSRVTLQVPVVELKAAG